MGCKEKWISHLCQTIGAMKIGDVRRLRGSNRIVTIVGESGKDVQVRTFSGVYRWVRRDDLMMPIADGCKWMRPWVDGDVLYTFFRWFFSPKMEKRFFHVTITLLIAYVTFKVLLNLFDLA